MNGRLKSRTRYLHKLPPLTTPDCVRIITSDEAVHDLPEKNLNLAYEIDPELRTIPGPDFNVLVLTREDRFFLWDTGIVWSEPNA